MASSTLTSDKGIFIVRPNSSTLMPVNIDSKDKANNTHCKIGGTHRAGFNKNKYIYIKLFGSDVNYTTIAVLAPSDVLKAKKLIINEIINKGIKSIGNTDDWFLCSDKGESFKSLILKVLDDNHIPYTV